MKASSAANHQPQDAGKHPEVAPLKFFGLEIPLPPWAVSAVALVAVVAVPFAVYSTMMRYIADDSVNKDLQNKTELLRQTKSDLQQLVDKLRTTQDDYFEYSKHAHEQGNEFHGDSTLSVIFYGSDGCVSVLRRTGSSTISNWIKDPSRTSPPVAAPGPVNKSVLGESTGPEAQVFFQLASHVPQPATPVQQSGLCGGKCLNPHPGNFTSSTGPKQGCWVQIYRKWDDGCAHYQWFNACSATWDSDQLGHPRVYWTCCRH